MPLIPTRNCFVNHTLDNQLYEILVGIDNIKKSRYIDGEVQYYADLPVTLDDPPIDSAYLVLKGSGVWLINRKPAGIYVRTANNGNLADWEYAGAFPDVVSDANFRIYNSADSSKELKFDVSLINAATLRTLAVQDKDGTIALAEDVVEKQPMDTLVVNMIRSLTQTEYDAIAIPDAQTLYIIVSPAGKIYYGSTLITSTATAQETFETVSKNLKSYPATLNYSGSALSNIVYSLGMTTITKTFNYNIGGDLTSIVLSGDTPTGISLTKTLGYTSGNLTSITYT